MKTKITVYSLKTHRVRRRSLTQSKQSKQRILDYVEIALCSSVYSV